MNFTYSNVTYPKKLKGNHLFRLIVDSGLYTNASIFYSKRNIRSRERKYVFGIEVHHGAENRNRRNEIFERHAFYFKLYAICDAELN